MKLSKVVIIVVLLHVVVIGGIFVIETVFRDQKPGRVKIRRNTTTVTGNVNAEIGGVFCTGTVKVSYCSLNSQQLVEVSMTGVNTVGRLPLDPGKHLVINPSQ